MPPRNGEREQAAEVAARAQALDVAHGRLKQFAADGADFAGGARDPARPPRISRRPAAADNTEGMDAAMLATELRIELIAAEREYIYGSLQRGEITDEARRRIERELDLEEASIACKREGGEEPPL